MTIDSPFLSYIDVWHQGFLPLRLTVGEARDLDPLVIRVGSLVPIKDGSAEKVFQGRVVHVLVNKPHVEVQVAGQVEVESIDSWGAKVENVSDEMVVHWTMTADRLLLGRRPAAQQQIQGRDQPLPLLPSVAEKGLEMPTSFQ